MVESSIFFPFMTIGVLALAFQGVVLWTLCTNRKLCCTMKYIMFCLFLVGVMLTSCTGEESIGQSEKISPGDLAALMMNDAEVVEFFALQQEIANQRSLAILDGATLPDGPSTLTLSTSLSATEVSRYLRDHGLKEDRAAELGTLYANRNAIMPGIQNKYGPYRDKFTDGELVEFAQLLPVIRSNISAAAAVEKLEKER